MLTAVARQLSIKWVVPFVLLYNNHFMTGPFGNSEFLPDYRANSLQISAKNFENSPETKSKCTLHSLKFSFRDTKENIL